MFFVWFWWCFRATLSHWSAVIADASSFPDANRVAESVVADGIAALGVKTQGDMRVRMSSPDALESTAPSAGSRLGVGSCGRLLRVCARVRSSV